MGAEPAVAWQEPAEGLLRFGQEVLAREGTAVLEMARRLSSSFAEAARIIHFCRGCLHVSGLGKAGIVGQKIAATFASLGTRSYFLHPTEAFHGDLGRVRGEDVLLALSSSGETEEILRLCEWVRQLGVKVVAVTQRETSSLGRLATVTIEVGGLEEACPLGLAPTTSTTVMLAVGDALALAVARLRNFGREDFARFHPGGTLGRKLSRVEDLMRPLSQCRVARQEQTVREVLVATSRPGRRTGAIMLVDEAGRLVGIFTDSDLARLFERRADAQLDRPIAEVMTATPITIREGARLSEAVRILAERKISELPVLDSNGRPMGLIDVTDLVSLWPEEFPEWQGLGKRPPLSICAPPPEEQAVPDGIP
jgi:arabinose-5-phosphate isomerase